MKAAEWTHEDQEAAFAEGWLVDLDHASRIVAADEKDVFVGEERDTEALLFVLGKADKSDLHRRAIKAAFGF